MRWEHPVHGTVQPSTFVPIAEQIGLSSRLTWWCLNTALRELKLWNHDNDAISVAINITASDLTDKEFSKAVIDAIGIWNIKPQQLTLEITESSLMKDIELSSRILNNIRVKGVRVAIDDFGTGYSSLAYFKHLPVDEIKIDRSFITKILESEFDLHIVNTINEMAKALDLSVVAEGVESNDSKQIVTKLGCNTIQGFYYSKPIPLDDFIEWINSFQRTAK
jgi:EAL domain-containing protein (putative c-di-GMP-specific phosphodiesterase class I)